jgi:hypothetical protein
MAKKRPGFSRCWDVNNRKQQGLKPAVFCGLCGTAKAVPCYKAQNHEAFFASIERLNYLDIHLPKML